MDLVDTEDLGGAFNREFAMVLTGAQWRSILEPARKRSLGQLCTVIAMNGRIPVIRPFMVAGRSCWSAGAFLTLRTHMAQHGVPTEQLRPSSAIADYEKDYVWSIIDGASKLAPGVLPTANYDCGCGRTEAIFAACAGLGLITLLSCGSLRYCSARSETYTNCWPLFLLW